jgi:hypothetical protein
MRPSARFSLAVLAAAAVGISACGGSDDGPEPATDAAVVEDPGPVHVHGLSVNPADDALFIATHTGLFRAPPGERRATRVGDRFQDTMGFTVIGPDRFLGSGHPDGRDRLPPFLGLIRSFDAGRTWKSVSLLGERDFHVLEAAGQRVYGYGSDFDTRKEGLLVSLDSGHSWQARPAPEPLISLAIHPEDPDRVLASGEQALHLSEDGGQRWRQLSGQAGLVVWPQPTTAYRVTLDGRVSRSGDGGVTWRGVGDTAGPPSAFENAGDQLYVALHDGTVKRSSDGGRSWVVRSRP